MMYLVGFLTHFKQDASFCLVDACFNRKTNIPTDDYHNQFIYSGSLHAH